jgi:sugar/nucleoside kinase (ribokinase family)
MLPASTSPPRRWWVARPRASFILITPDGERTMNTYLGASAALSPADVDERVVAASAITYLERLPVGSARGPRSVPAAAAAAHRAGRVSLTLSDACVDRFRDEFLSLIRTRTVDIVSPTPPSFARCTQTASSTPRSRRSAAMMPWLRSPSVPKARWSSHGTR